jgi:hypothetical protein
MADHVDIIPLASRRRARAPATHAAPEVVGPPRLEGSTEKGAWIVLVALVSLLAAPLAFYLAGESGAQRSIAGLTPSVRAAVFQRAFEDVRETCRLPGGSADGALRDWCRSTASFVVLFPECDAACGRAARALLPQARR